MSCPDPLLLSQLADRELPDDEATAVRAHVGSCAACGALMARASEAMAGASRAASLAALARDAALGERDAAGGCVTPSRVAAWLDGDLRKPEGDDVARHVQACDACLGAALAARRILRSLEEPPRLRAPSALKERVAAGWSGSTAAVAAASVPAEDAPARASELAGALSELVIRVTRSGARLVERHLVAPLRELVELPVLAPAMRAGEIDRAAALRFELRAAAARVSATVVPAGDLVGLTLALESDAGELLPDQRVFLRRHGRSIFSARTAADGTLHMPGLQPGVYEVSCPGIGTAFRIDLRA